MRFLFVLLASFFHVQAGEPKVLMIVGDSLTEGYGVSQAQAYPSLLQAKLQAAGFKDWKVVNAGISGSTAASAPGRVSWALKQKPALVLLALGANDGLRGAPVKSIEENLSAAITACKKADVKVLLVGMRMPPNYGAEYTRDFNALYPRLARRFKVPLLPFLLVDVAGKPELNQPDGIHPNEKGHALVAETVFQAVRKLL